MIPADQPRYDYQPPPDTGLDILYEDADLLALNKPAGLLSVPGRGADKQDSLASRVQAEFPQAMIVHRLDMETSGLMLMARSPDMHRLLNEQFAKRQVHKRYVAVVDGLPPSVQGVIDLPLLTDWPNRPRQKVDFLQGKASQTRYRLLSHCASNLTSRLALEPVTGRSHQLRVHLQYLGHPILGDRLYAPPEALAKAGRLLLHAESLRLLHPRQRRPLSLRCPVDF
jgi:tRNA pseudouridine32 synthase/23S rRNA pseudouridine746 synthase